MAKRKRKKTNKNWFSFSSSKRRTKAQIETRRQRLLLGLKLVAALIVVAAICVGLWFFDKYVRNEKGIGDKWVKLELTDAPVWMSEDLGRYIFETAGDGDGLFKLTDKTASQIGQKLKNLSWLYNVKVKTCADSVKVSASYYQPTVLIDNGKRKVYLASDRLDVEYFNLIILNYVPIYDLHIVQLKGVDTRYMPSAGSVWDKEDAHAAVELIRLLSLMDRNMQAKYAEADREFKPLLNEIGIVDVSNFAGRKKTKAPHIILYAVDGTEIYWGAMDGNLEAVRAEKLSKLYQYYKDYGTLKAKSNGDARYIDLRVPDKIVPLP